MTSQTLDINDKTKYYQFYEVASHEFSKFYPAPIQLHNVIYKTVEHYYQCQKFITTNADIYNMILDATTIQSAHLLGQNKKFLRDDWFSVNKQVYYEGQKAKFQQHSKLKKQLLETGNKQIIAIDPVEFWGITVTNDNNNKQIINGQNNSGKLLMQIRNEFIKENEQKDNENDNANDIYEFYEVYTHPFSKFYPKKVVIDNIEYQTVEHYYQSQKYVKTDPQLYKLIMKSKTIEMAHLLGQNTSNIRSDWFQVNKQIYCRGQRAKFDQHKDVKNILLSTKGKTLRCIDTDKFWGVSVDHYNNDGKLKGQNMSGILLEKIRNEYLKKMQQQNKLLATVDHAIDFVSK